MTSRPTHDILANEFALALADVRCAPGELRLELTGDDDIELVGRTRVIVGSVHLAARNVELRPYDRVARLHHQRTEQHTELDRRSYDRMCERLRNFFEERGFDVDFDLGRASLSPTEADDRSATGRVIVFLVLLVGAVVAGIYLVASH